MKKNSSVGRIKPPARGDDLKLKGGETSDHEGDPMGKGRTVRSEKNTFLYVLQGKITETERRRTGESPVIPSRSGKSHYSNHRRARREAVTWDASWLAGG